MDRFEFEDLISAYIEHDLPLNKRKEIEVYLCKNPSQDKLVKEIAKNMDALKKLPKIASRNNINQKLMEKIKSKNRNINTKGTESGNIFGFTFINASALLGLIFVLFTLSFEILGFAPMVKNSQPSQLLVKKNSLGESDIAKEKKKEDFSNPSLTTLQNDTTKKEKLDFSKNIKYVND